MDFQLSAETEAYRSELARWTDRRRICPGFDAGEWRAFSERELLVTQPGETVVDTAVAFMEISRKGLPGPLLGTRMAADANGDVRELAANGQVIATVRLRRSHLGPSDVASAVPVGWGAVADLVVDHDGAVLAPGPLPPVTTSYLHPHGWWQGATDALPTGDTVRAWVLSGALLCGLATGELELATRYVSERLQFGRPIGSFQAVQFPLAQCKALTEGLRLMVLDAAWRSSTQRADTDPAAALLCVSADRISRLVADACHQAYGAAGLANESGLNELTWGARWLRHEMGLLSARELIGSRRSTAATPPPSLVLQGFS
jgi:hypothetical protein